MGCLALSLQLLFWGSGSFPRTEQGPGPALVLLGLSLEQGPQSFSAGSSPTFSPWES